jgi:hypothetical protein
VKGRWRIGDGWVLVQVRCARGGHWTWEEDGVVVGPEDGVRRGFFTCRSIRRGGRGSRVTGGRRATNEANSQ